MSRNIGSTCCSICYGDVVLEESPRLGSAADFGAYADEYAGKLVVANARCGACGALYLAWVRHFGHRWNHLANERNEPFVDLSYRHAFNDEPAPEDLPPVAKLREIERRHREVRLAALIEEHERESAARLAKIERARGAALDPSLRSRWESYL